MTDIATTPLDRTTAVIVDQVDPTVDRAHWLTLRRQGLGGSDAAAICGEDPYRSPFTVWLEKVADDNDDDRDNEAMFWGRRLESVVRDVTAEREQLAIDGAPYLLRHPDHEFILATPDGLAEGRPGHGPGVYEGKTGGHWAGQAWADNQVPAAYVLQAMHYLAVTGLGWAVYGCLIGGQQLVVRYVERDQDLIDHLVAIEGDFWKRVTDRTPPAPDGSKATTDLLAHLYDVTPGAVHTANDPASVRGLLDTRADAKADEKAAAKRAAEAENVLKTVAGDHEIVLDPDGRTLFTWKQVTTNRLDGKALKEAHPDTHAAFTRPSTSRRFYVPTSKGA